MMSSAVLLLSVVVVVAVISLSSILVVSSFQFSTTRPPATRTKLPILRWTTRYTSNQNISIQIRMVLPISSASQLGMAGFGTTSTSTSSNKNKKKGGGKGNGKKKKKSIVDNKEVVQKRLLKQVKKVYGGITSEAITQGTEQRIANMLGNEKYEQIRYALELRTRVDTFQTKVRGLDVETLRERYTPEELQHAVEDRTTYEDYLQQHHLTSDDLQIAMQRITWNASADAKAFRAVTGTMPITFQHRVTKAAQYAYNSREEQTPTTTKNNNNNNNNNNVLDVGCGYGVTIPFLKKVGYTSEQISGIDVSTEMIQHAKTFYPDIGNADRFIAQDFLQFLTTMREQQQQQDRNDSSRGMDGDTSSRSTVAPTQYHSVVFCSSLHDLPDMKRALLDTRDVLLVSSGAAHPERTTATPTTTQNSRIVIVHPQGASHVQKQTKQNPLLVPRGLPTTQELQDWLCGGTSNSSNSNETDTATATDSNNQETTTTAATMSSTRRMQLIVEPAEPNSEQEIRDGYLAVLELSE